MLLKFLFLFSFVVTVLSDNLDSEDYVDSLIKLLMNGDSVDNDDGVNNEAEPSMADGLWQCGDCESIDDNKLIYSEVNEVANSIDDLPTEIQIGVAASSMKCVTVKTDIKASIVKRVSGACSGGSATLTVAPPQRFIVDVYA